MTKSLIQYLFPPRTPREKLPLLPTRASGEHSRYGEPPPEWAYAIRTLRELALARTEADAVRVLRRRKYPEVRLEKIVKLERRERRYESRLRRAWRRFKEMF